VLTQSAWDKKKGGGGWWWWWGLVSCCFKLYGFSIVNVSVM